ncbi:hypothetical protein C8N46_11027 [Kordia periserrulae]|uniref:Uncharacterized protein n=1 Tax=Kordia periserrulae TaxID=701523 RepID=A0A2T6BTA8_9FLAO|nr:hypothetical protein [Kordia periserrulae]PTX59197.1 hypothetical protein C8N46_11027 [Kordia periserrulae]
MVKKIALDELPKRLLNSETKNEDLVMMYGFVGEGTADNNIRFYLDASLQKSTIIKNEDIMHYVKVTKSQSPIGGTVIWLKNAASYLNGNHTETKTKSQEHAAQFFQGDIYQQYVNTVQKSPQKQQNPYAPACGCGKCG